MNQTKLSKLIFLSCLILIGARDLCAQIPYAFNYQGRAMNDAGEVYSVREIALRISLTESFDEGTIVFSEEHVLTTSMEGLFSLRVGEGIPILGNLRNISWGDDKYFIRIEIDPDGGENYTDLGTAQLYSVPYALYSETSGDSGSGGSDDQQISFDGTTLTIEDGNSVDLSSLSGGGMDADSDPNNEIQSLSLSGDQLSISSGNTVTLPSGGGGTGLWTQETNDRIHHNGLFAGVGPDPNNNAAYIGSTSDNIGLLKLEFDQNGSETTNIWADGEMGYYGLTPGGYSFQISHNHSTGAGFLNINDKGNKRIGLTVLTSGGGFLDVEGPNGEDNIRLTNLSGSPNNGFVGVLDSQQQTTAGMYASSVDAGIIFTDGPNGNNNTRLSYLGSNSNLGYITVFDEQGNEEAGMYVNPSGDGVIFADVKNFRTPHPIFDDQDIVYASLEGPEAAAYIRGSSKLVDGQAFITFPDHFKHIISNNSLTIMLTPLSADSKGMAIVKKDRNGFEVRELLKGQGTYQFDWEAKAIRSGFENYKVIRPKAETRSAPMLHSAQNSKDHDEDILRKINNPRMNRHIKE